VNERDRCTCHDIGADRFREACAAGAHNVKTCFKTIGCLPKCNNCIPMVRSVLCEFEPLRFAGTSPGAGPCLAPVSNASN